MCIELCSSCFYSAKPFVKPYALSDQRISPTHAIELLGSKVQPMKVSPAYKANCLTSNQLANHSLVVVFQVPAYGSLFCLSSQSCLTIACSLGSISKLTHMLPFSQSNSSLIRVIKCHHLSSANLVANIILTALNSRVHIGKIMSRWCKRCRAASNRRTLHIQIAASDRMQHLVKYLKVGKSLNLTYSVQDYGFLTTVSRLGSIGIKVLVLIF
jgi:hypothetical protein